MNFCNKVFMNQFTDNSIKTTIFLFKMISNNLIGESKINQSSINI